MSQYLLVLCSLFSGIALALAIPNEWLLLGSPLVGMFALVPFYLAVSSAKSYRAAFCCGWVQAFTAHMLSSFWLGNFRGYAAFTLGASAVGTGFVCAFSTLVFYVPFSWRTSVFFLHQRADLRPFLLPLRIFWFSALYTIWEWAKSYGFLAYPWGTLSMTAYTWPLVTQIADITGPYGVTFLFSLVSAVIGEGLLLVWRLPQTVDKRTPYASWLSCVTWCGVFAAFVVVYGAYQYLLPRKPIKTLNAVLVQQNLDPWSATDEEVVSISERLSEEKMTAFAKEGLSCDLVVWSEGVLAKYFPMAMLFYTLFPAERPLISFIEEMHVPFIIGAPLTIDAKQHAYGNATVLIDGDGNYQGAYVKMHLVPFAERIPFVQYEVVRKIAAKVAGSYGWTQGDEYVLYEIPVGSAEKKETVTVSTPICFDDAFSEVCRGLFLSGSEVFINLTNDAWSETKSAEWQHFAVAAYRAIEYRTTLARSTNAGVTTIVDPAGRMLATLPLFEEAALAARIPVYSRTMTIYAYWGDWFVAFLALCAAVCIALVSIKMRTKNL